jgi:endoglucanase
MTVMTAVKINNICRAVFASAVVCAMVLSCSGGNTDSSATSIAFAKKLGAGWNLGNTLDATCDVSVADYGTDTETYWGMPKTTKAMIDAVKNAGFTSIRIPVSWHNHLSNTSSYTIDAAWMARVKTIVDWAYNDGLYVIINVHHDNLSDSDLELYYGYAVTTDTTLQTKSKAYLSAVWTQIAGTFNSAYDEHLVFEVLNEPRCIGADYEWWVSDTTAMTAAAANSVIRGYESSCISAIRATGGNNAVRYIMVPAYAGSSSFLSTYTLPSDTASDKLLLSFHAYSPYNFAMYNSKAEDTTFDSSDKAELNSMFSTVHTLFSTTGIVIGETSASNKNNLSERVNWATYYFGTAYGTYGMPVILWDNGAYAANTAGGEQHGYFKRSDQTWYFPSIIKAALTAAGMTPGTLAQAQYDD